MIVMEAMAEELAGAEAVHACRVCGKGFQCGRSLGGHMRSHGEAAAAAAEIDADDEVGRVSVNGGRSFSGVVGFGAYGLRENPKKTRRLSDFADDEAEDGGGEHKEYGGYVDEEFITGEAEAEKIVAPAPVTVTVLEAPPRRRRRSMRVAAPVLPGASVFEKEVKDVALSLIKLSRDTGLRRSPVKVEPLERTEVKKTKLQPYLYHSDDDSALLQYGGDDDDIENGGGGAGRRASKSKKRRANYYTPDSSSKKRKQCEAATTTKRGRYECPGCGKVFSSYQALGGHRASHKRINISCSAPKLAVVTPEPEPSVGTYTSLSTLSPSGSPESVTIRARSRNSEAAMMAPGGHRRSHATAAGASSDDGELYGSASGSEEQEEEELHPVAIAGAEQEEEHHAEFAAAEQEEYYPVAIAGAEQEKEHLVAIAEQEVEEHDVAVMEEDEEEHRVAAVGFLDLNFPPAPSEEA